MLRDVILVLVSQLRILRQDLCSRSMLDPIRAVLSLKENGVILSILMLVMMKREKMDRRVSKPLPLKMTLLLLG
ncbi:hypothetical protein BVRB_1g010280 [Beta vulgaris subsp. vulgaris]|nr:hypothetical protein BVRB_1g010280 [Beta vulgaris subsp. vulgaris]